MPPTDMPMPYQIFRQPVKSATQPVQLPAGSVIDLFARAPRVQFRTLAAHTWIFRNPTRAPSLSRLPKAVRWTVFMRWGKGCRSSSRSISSSASEKLPHASTYNKADPPETQAEKHNFRDLENLWISINPQTGLITSAEVAQVQTIPH